MFTFFTLFFILFGFWTILFLFNSYFTLLTVLIGLIISFVITYMSLRLRLFSANSSFLFLQFGFYKILYKKIINYISETFYLAFQFLIPKNYIDPVIDYLSVENENIYENNLSICILNLNPGIISTMVKNQCIIIHSINKLFFTPNQLYFVSLETQKINDDSLI